MNERDPHTRPPDERPPSGAQGPGPPRHRRARRQARRRRNVLVALLAVGVLFAVVAGTSYVFVQGYGGAPDYSGAGSGSVVVEVDRGASVSAIGATLERRGVVKSRQAFVRAARGHPEARSISPGHYRLRRHMEASLAFQALLDPSSRIEARVTIPEGTRMSKIFAIVAKHTDISVSELEQAARDREALGLPEYARTVEGYLFPATYTVEPDDTARELLRRMVAEFEETAEDLNLEQRARQRGMSPHEIVTVASLVQGEARRPEDFRKVAAVVYNRLAAGMRLQFDSTVNYVTGEGTLQVSKEDLEVDSPYNTYQHGGLPPGPINSPGTRALQAALNPAEGDWLYFVTTNPSTGTTKFTDSYQEFQRFKRQFERNTNSG